VGRIFTPLEATRMLPLVRRVVRDVLECGRRLRVETRPEEGRRLRRRLQIFLGELRDLGCEYRDWSFEVGVVDFPTELDGRPAWLCWRSDEPAVTHFHLTSVGYTDRSPLAASRATEQERVEERQAARRARLEARSAHFGISIAGSVGPARCDCAAPRFEPLPDALRKVERALDRAQDSRHRGTSEGDGQPRGRGPGRGERGGP